jgi:hypothetical protein
MTEDEWNKAKAVVCDQMREYTRPFVTPLTTETDTEVRLVGTGSYVLWDRDCLLLTCEHVAKEQPMHYRFFGSDDVFVCQGHWEMDAHPIDTAVTVIPDTAWEACEHRADKITSERFASKHSISEQAELMFFRGFAGENAHYAFGVHEANGTGYTSQEKLGSGDDQIFEIFWQPSDIQYTENTSAGTKRAIRHENPEGLSGSLVWNTRYLEMYTKVGTWSPCDAVVTGIVRRWDPNTNSLLVWRVEHIRDWINQKWVSR